MANLRKIVLLSFLLLMPTLAWGQLTINKEAVLSANSTIIRSMPSEGLVGYWSFDSGSTIGSTAYDLSGYANSGTITGAVDTTGVVRQGRWFDGATDNVQTASVDASALTALTYSIWIKTTAATGVLFSWDSYRFIRIAGVTANKVNSGMDGSSAGSVTSTSDINDGAWHHVAVTSTASAQSLFIDGVLEDIATETLSTVSGAFYIGRDKVNSFPFEGTLDEPRVYYNRALSQAEITVLANQTVPKISVSANNDVSASSITSIPGRTKVSISPAAGLTVRSMIIQ